MNLVDQQVLGVYVAIAIRHVPAKNSERESAGFNSLKFTETETVGALE